MTLKDNLTSIFDVFSRRSAPQAKGYETDAISFTLRNRVLLLYRDLLSGQWPNRYASQGGYTQEFWEDMARLLQHLYGKPTLSTMPTRSAAEDAFGFVSQCNPAHFFDFLELTFKTECLRRVIDDRNELVDAINEIFRVEDAPYQLTPMVMEEEESEGMYGRETYITTVALPKVVRAEDEVTHSEAVAPALSVLAAPHFKTANLEFRDALEEYRKSHYGDCLTKCNSAFESVMKALCKRNQWSFDEKKATAWPLLDIIVSHSTLDKFFRDPLALIGTMRNRLSSSHGGGTAVRNVERHVAQYAITSTAAAIVLLVHAAGR